MDKNIYKINSSSDTINSFTVPNFENNNNNTNNTIAIANILLPQQNKTFNTTKNNQIVEHKYISKIRRQLNKFKSSITHDPKNKHQNTNE